MAGLKDQLREKTLASTNRRIVKVDIDLAGNGELTTIGVRQPSLAVRRKLAMVTHEKANPNTATLQDVQAVIECACDPETGELLYTDHDRDQLLAQPSWVDVVAHEAGQMMSTGPTGPACKQILKDEDGLDVKDANGQPKVCGYVPRPDFIYCPRCGTKLPGALEVAKGN